MEIAVRARGANRVSRDPPSDVNVCKLRGIAYHGELINITVACSAKPKKHQCYIGRSMQSAAALLQASDDIMARVTTWKKIENTIIGMTRVSAISNEKPG